MADSFLNLEGKEALASPWDVHAAKLVDCVACHYARNSPVRSDGKQARLDVRDERPAPRVHRRVPLPPRSPARGAGLPRLPRRAQGACVPAVPRAPPATSSPARPATPRGRWRPRGDGGRDGASRRRARRTCGTGTSRARTGEPLNAATVDAAPAAARHAHRSRRRAAPHARERRVPLALGLGRGALRGSVRASWHAPSSPGARTPRRCSARSTSDRDGRLAAGELRLDTPAKVEAVATRLRALGVEQPRIEGVLEPHVLAHGIPARERALRDCGACHPRTRGSTTRTRSPPTSRAASLRGRPTAGRASSSRAARADGGRRARVPTATRRGAGRAPRARPHAPGLDERRRLRALRRRRARGRGARAAPVRAPRRRRGARPLPRPSTASTCSAGTSGSGTGRWRSPESLLMATGVVVHNAGLGRPVRAHARRSDVHNASRRRAARERVPVALLPPDHASHPALHPAPARPAASGRSSTSSTSRAGSSRAIRTRTTPGTS